MYLGGIGVDIIIEGKLPNANVGNMVYLIGLSSTGATRLVTRVE